MERFSLLVLASLVILCVCAVANRQATAEPPNTITAKAADLPSVEQARQQAQLLHEAMHATLQVVHHEYYREDEGLAIPAATLKKVFDELGQRRKVGIRWLAVDAQAMNVDHVAQDDFEREAAKSLAAGKVSHESTADNVYRHAGAVVLTADCLKCHLPNRTSTKPRTAALIISIPVSDP